MTQSSSSNWMGKAWRVLRTKGPVVFVRAMLNRFAARLTIRKAIQRQPSRGGRAAVHFAMTAANGYLRPLQLRSEIERVVDLVERQQPKVVLEIGTAHGGTLYMWTRVAAEGALLISVDLPGGEFGGGYPESKVPIYRSFALPHQTLHLLRGDSHASQTLDLVRSTLAGRPVDFLFIDGDHRYEGVKQDFEQYSSFVAPGGIIGMHDITPPLPGDAAEVDRFWQELKATRRYRMEEIIESPGQRGYGIGLVWV
jgi:predicted O-methyltransferase YrrM